MCRQYFMWFDVRKKKKENVENRKNYLKHFCDRCACKLISFLLHLTIIYKEFELSTQDLYKTPYIELFYFFLHLHYLYFIENHLKQIL